MAAQGKQTPSREQHPNEPSEGARDEHKGSAKAPQISAERKRYLAKQYGWSEEQIDVIRNQICAAAADAELEFFLATCKRVKLDPFARQIYFIKRKQRIEDDWGNSTWIDVGRPETSIDGLRASAEQTGEYEGQGPMAWSGRDGKWCDVWLDAEPPSAARSTIFRKGLREPMVTVALLSEFRPQFKKKTGEEAIPAMWRKMPANQLAKCAEALGFRRAFPRDLSGLYISEELEHTSQQYAAPEPAATAAASNTGAAPGKVIDVSETKALPAPGAPTIVELKATIAGAQTRADLAPVGRVLTDAVRKRDDDAAQAMVAELKPLMESKWRSLAPAGKSK